MEVASEPTVQEEVKESPIPELKENVKAYREKTLQKARSAGRGISEYVDKHPMTVGFVGLSAGIIIGSLTSGIFRNTEILDETRKSLKEKTRDFLKDTREKAGHILEVAQRAAKEEAERQNLINR